MRNKLLSSLAERGTLLEPQAADYLLRSADPLARVEELLRSINELPLVLTLEDILKAEEIARRAAAQATQISMGLQGTRVSSFEEKSITVATPRKEELGIPKVVPGSRKDYAVDIKILKDITGNSTCQGKIEDFAHYFENRFQILSSLLKVRRELLGFVDIAKAKKLSKDVRFICIVTKVRTTKAGHRIVEVEDLDESVSVLLLKDGPLADDPVVPDEVIGVVGSSWKDGLIIAQTIVRPDVPVKRESRRSDVPISVAFVSDLHVGSKLFLRERWLNFVEWLNNGDETALRTKYLVMSGDVVDGIGVYPNQDQDLCIDDIYRQYEEFSKLLEGVPDDLKIIMLPGNHDAVRPAEPQPALPQEIRRLFSADIAFVGNPCTFQLHGVHILSYHGRSMDDFVGSLVGMSYDKPIEAMREMLRKRHLAPVYGGKTPIAPESRDYLIIDDVPDIFVTGHVHGSDVDEYRGVKLINSSAWQSQTSYQRMHNINPKPCNVTVVDLASGRSFIKGF